MSGPIAALLTRFNALEAKVAEQAEQLELLSLMTPLQAITEGLKGAEPAGKREFIAILNGLIAEFGEEVIAEAAAKPAKVSGLSIKAPKEEKVEKKKRAPTNHTGPAAYNAKLREVWRAMVAEAIEEELPELPEVTGEAEVDAKAEEAYVAAFGALAKKAGISYRDSQRETAILTIMEQEGKERAEAEALFAGRKADEKAAKEAKKSGAKTPAPTTPRKPAKAKSAAPSAASSPKVAKAPKAAAPEVVAAAKAETLVAAAASLMSSASASASPTPLSIRVPAEKPVAAKTAPAEKKTKKAAKPEVSEAEREFLASLVELGIEEKTIAGKVYFYDSSTEELYAKVEGVFDLGDKVGVFDPETDSIVSA